MEEKDAEDSEPAEGQQKRHGPPPSTEEYASGGATIDLDAYKVHVPVLKAGSRIENKQRKRKAWCAGTLGKELGAIAPCSLHVLFSRETHSHRRHLCPFRSCNWMGGLVEHHLGRRR